MVPAEINIGYLTTEPSGSADAHGCLSALIATRVAAMLRERAAHGLPTFRLSQAGNALGPELRRLERLSGRRLIDIVRDDLGYDVRSAPNAPNAPFIALRADVAPPIHRLRIPEPIWRAFTTPLAPGLVRGFSAQEGRHRDHAPGRAASRALLPVPQDLIHPAPPRHLADAVAASIRSWMQQHGLSA